MNPKEALDSIEKMQAIGLEQGLYPRWFSVATALWSGLLAASMGSPWLLWILFGGFVAFSVWRRRTPAWIKEIQSKRDLVIVLCFSLLIGGLFIAAYIALKFYGLRWAPYLAGLLIAVIQYSIMEISYAPIRARQTS